MSSTNIFYGVVFRVAWHRPIKVGLLRIGRGGGGCLLCRCCACVAFIFFLSCHKVPFFSILIIVDYYIRVKKIITLPDNAPEAYEGPPACHTAAACSRFLFASTRAEQSGALQSRCNFDTFDLNHLSIARIIFRIAKAGQLIFCSVGPQRR